MQDWTGLPPTIATGELSQLTPSDSPIVLDLFGRCADYFLLQDGEAATAADVEELFADVPPSKSEEDQLIFGFWQDSTLQGVVQLLMGYPEPRDFYLGFLLLDPALRGRGLGRSIYRAIERWSAGRGAQRMLVCVLNDNESALAFWRSLGFELRRMVEPRAFKQKIHGRHEFVRAILPASPTI